MEKSLIIGIDIQLRFMDLYKDQIKVQEFFSKLNLLNGEYTAVIHQYKNPLMKFLSSLTFKGAGVDDNYVDSRAIFKGETLVKDTLDIFATEEVATHIINKGVGKLYLFGQDGMLAVKMSAIQGIKLGFEVFIVPELILSHTENAWVKEIDYLFENYGIKRISLDELLNAL